ncbi:MAG: SusC/RagA family TonB-linked outer membrane protein [Tannerella sp.]|jgi:TonB-linked SusC/RagA family outer membrane protein|nr:SusC/RagA family TonB-linked outer membrane protein [Tannerella sp.]
MRIFTFSLLYLLMGIGTIVAQTIKVTGTVLSDDDGQPIIGATVVVKGSTAIGTVTDIDGNFVLEIPSSAKTLQISFVGMTPQDVAVTGQHLRVVLKSSIQLEEVVVTASGIVREKRAIGYSASTVSGEELTEARTSDAITAISGKMAGVQVGSSSSDPGASNSIIIRGVSSLGGSNQALFVVDGVPMNNSSVRSSDPLNGGYDYGNAANLVNPDDIASMTVLKGAAATALYGNRGANGVVMITTKSGKSGKGKGLGIEYNGGIQFASFLRLPEMQNEFGQGWDGLKTMDENGSWGPRFDGRMRVWGTVYNNSQKMKPYEALPNNLVDFFENGFRYNNSLSLSGGNDQTTYYASFSQLSDDGMIPDAIDTYDRYTISLRGSHQTGKLKLSTSINYAMQTNSFAPTGQGLTIINSLMQTPRDISIVGLKDLSDPFNTVEYYYTPYGVGNPYYVINVMENEFNQDKLYGKLQADYQFTDWLSATYRIGLDAAYGTNKVGTPRITAAEGSPNEGAIDSEGNVLHDKINRRELNHDLLVNFKKLFMDKLNVDVTGGWNVNERKSSEVLALVSGLDIPTFYHLSNSASTPTVTEVFNLRRLCGLYGEAQLGWDDMLYLTLSARNDWSSTLPKGNNSFFYPGSTLSFVFTELLSDEVKNIISFGKLRLAYGKTGNDADPYVLTPTYAKSEAYNEFGTIAFPLKGKNAFTLGNALGNINLTPEMTTEWEIGTNLSFFDGRIGLDVAYYDRKTDRQIYSLTMDAATGFTSQTTNLGVISNKGIEVLVTGQPIKTADFSWNISVNYTKNRSKVVSLPEELGDETTIWGFSSGTSLVAAVGQPVGVYKAYSSEKSPDGKIVVSPTTGLPVISGESEIVGDSNFDYEMGIGNTFKYKNLSLGFDFDIRQGGLIFSRTKDILYFTGNAVQTLYNDREPFIVPNSVNKIDGEYVENTTPVSSTSYDEYFTNGTINGDADFLIPRSYVKLRSANIGYMLPKSVLQYLPFVSSVRLSVFGTNLLLWTPKGNSFIDPEITTFGNDLEGRFGEFSANPTTRKYGFNLSVKF